MAEDINKKEESTAKKSSSLYIRDHHLIHDPNLRHLHLGWFLVTIIFFSFTVGFGGGWAAMRLAGGQNTLDQIADNRQEIVLQESEVIAEVAEKVKPSVVSITVDNVVGNSFFAQSSRSAGTGIILTDDGLVVTNKHVLGDNIVDLKLITSDGREFKNIKVVDRDPFNDIAYLRIEGAKNLTPAKLGDSSQVRVGDKVVAIGNALGQFDNTVTSGIISGLGRPIVADGSFGRPETLQNLFQTDAAINPGNSGGPLANLNGEIIGMNTAVAGGNAENIGFAIPVNDIKPGIASVKENNRLVKPFLGVRYVAVTSDVVQRYNLSVDHGALIISSNSSPAIVPDSPADKAGLRERDVITEVDGEKVDQGSGLVTLINQHKTGEKVELTVSRGKKTFKVQVVLEEASSNF